ncbi:MAG: ribonuclease HII [Wenzhouxiangellaceae bacterium]|nr:ribonuclease HII [Wenzhouxiangellaceae bacterium]
MLLVAGVDEAGRGPLAGPVVAAAVVLDARASIDGLADSKKLPAERREALARLIHARARCVGIGQCTAAEIDRLNILNATMLAMQRAVAMLDPPPHRVLIDGNRAPDFGAIAARPIAARTIIGGDGLEPAISAASIVAKVRRDRLMRDLHARYPEYGFDRHKGYATAAHLAALARLGPTPEHRRSFSPCRQPDLFGPGQA